MSAPPPTQPFRRGQRIRASDLNRELRARPTIRGGAGISVSGVSTSAAVRQLEVTPLQPWFWAWLTSATALGSNQWTYGFEEVRLDDADSYAGWVTRTGGRSGTARNMYEVGNDGTGAESNGVNVGTDAPDGCSIVFRPVGNGAAKFPVQMWELIQSDGNAVEYWFREPNAAVLEVTP